MFKRKGKPEMKENGFLRRIGSKGEERGGEGRNWNRPAETEQQCPERTSVSGLDSQNHSHAAGTLQIPKYTKKATRIRGKPKTNANTNK